MGSEMCIRDSVYIFIRTGHNFEFLSFVFILFVLFSKKFTNKQCSDVIKVKKNGYTIMSCSKEYCDRIATYGLSRGSVGMFCNVHMKDNMVKVFGCEVYGCRARVVRGEIMCKKHL